MWIHLYISVEGEGTGVDTVYAEVKLMIASDLQRENGRMLAISLHSTALYMYNITNHPRNGVVYDFGHVCLSVCLSIRR